MSFRNNVYDSKYYNVTVGLWKDLYNDFCPNRKTAKHPFMCRSAEFQLAADYMKCIGIKSFVPVLYDRQMVPSDQNDLWPFLAAVYNTTIHDYFSTTPVFLGEYSFVMGTTVFDSLDLLASSYILLTPFKLPIWIISILLTLAALAGMLLSRKINFDISDNVLSVTQWTFVFSTTCGIIFSGLYVTNLTAVVNIKARSFDPFSSIEELTTMVKNGDKTLISENTKLTYIWSVIRGETLIFDHYPEKFKKLFQATWYNPPLEYKNFDELCYQLMKNSSLVYVGRITTLEERCSQYCFWKLDMPIVPYTYLAYFAKKYWILREQANLCVDFMRSSREVDMARSKHWPNITCNHKIESDLIKFPSIISVLWAYLIGNLLSASAFVMELHLKWKKLQNIDKVEGISRTKSVSDKNGVCEKF